MKPLAQLSPVAVVCIFTVSLPAFTEETANARLKSLYDAHQWAELRVALQGAKGPSLYHGAAAVVFDHAREAENLLSSTIRSTPRSDQAYEAYEWLTHLYLFTGQYRRLISTMEA